MSMHLCGPALTTTGRKKGRQKFRNAAQAQQARQLAEDWAALKQRHGVTEQPRRRAKSKTQETWTYNIPVPAGRETAQIPSRDTGSTGAVAAAASPRYTGTKVKGIGLMHKSNFVPIFNDDEAVDIARMRR